MSEAGGFSYPLAEGAGRAFSAGRSISVGALAWLLTAGVFVALRLGAAFEAPVGGAELVHLSGAWNAHLGIDDTRYVPSLFQALSALLLHASSSELPSRLLAVAASATIPLAVYCLRPRLGEGGALLTLIVLAFDPLGILVGGTATAMGFDTAVALWLFVPVERWNTPAFAAKPSLRLIAVALLAFALAAAGSLVLPVAVAVTVVFLVRRPAVSRGAAGVAVMGGLAGIGLASGLAGEPRVAPFALFSAGFEQRWSGPLLGEVLMLYAVPLVIAGTAIAVVSVWSRFRVRTTHHENDLLLLWAALAGAWVLVSLTRHTFVPAVALTTPLALLLGPALSRWAKAVRSADWTIARFLVPAVLLLLVLAMAIALDWARTETVGAAPSKTRMAFLLAGAGLGMVALLLRRTSWPAAATVSVVVGGLLTLSNAFAMAVHAADDPLPSPFSPAVAGEVRVRALAARSTNGGPIVIHDSLRAQATWPFRDSGVVVFATRVPPDAAFVVWPSDLPPPQSVRAVEGNFALTSQVHTPLNDGLDYLHWLLERNTLAGRPASVAVYTRAGP